MVVKPSVNCNWKDHDQAKLVNQGSHGSCEDRRLYFHQHRFTWGQIEREVNDEDLCVDYFDYGILLRDPIDLAESLMNFYGLNASDVVKNIQCVRSKGQGTVCDDCTHVEKHIQDIKRKPPWYFMDNYLVRILGGRSTYNLPAGGVTAEQAEATIEMLKTKFKVVLLYKDLADPNLFRNVFNWAAPPRSVLQTKKNRHGHTTRFTEDQARELRQLLAPDYKVYEYFSQLSLANRTSRFAASKLS